MKNPLFFLLLILLSCSKNPNKISKKDINYIEKDKETGWFRVHNKQNKWGFIDKDSSIVIPFEYDFVNPFENHLAYAKQGSKEFFITYKNLKLEGDFDAVSVFSEGLAPIKKNRKWGFINEKGKIVIPIQYDVVDCFRPSGLCAVSKNGKSGFIDKSGKEIIPIIYPEVNQQMLDKNVIVKNKGKWAFFDNQGKQLSDFIYNEVFRTDHYDFSKDIFTRDESTYFENGAVLVLKDNHYEFLNEKIEPAFPNNKFDSATVFDAFKNAIVKRNGKYGMIKPNGEFKVQLEYDFIEPYDTSHGHYSEYYNARKGKIFSIINRNLEKIGDSYEPIHNNFRTDNPTISFKNLKGKFGLVDRNGNIKIPFVYDEELIFEGDNYAIATKNNKKGIININGKVIFPFNFDNITTLDDIENIFIFHNKNEAKVMSINGKILISGYENIRPIFYDHSKFIVKKNKKFGVVDINNKILAPIIYDEFSDWVEYGPENRHIVKIGSKSGMLEEKTFKQKIPVDYDFVFISRFVVFVGKNKKYGIIDLNNKILCPLIYDEVKPSYVYGLGFGEDKIFARKGKDYFEININGKVLKSVTRQDVQQKTKSPRIEIPEPPPPPKIK
ncbi:WG repeat-containing protein [Epilithonimonas sp.]|uniref:WG repeat-containing protein n=1 Tax=Epilithonimonas sp. TaxID=2894511 RepID=UPI002899869D|nr:WG repeat-containing protein [Epilithonimonas sp.]